MLNSFESNGTPKWIYLGLQNTCNKQYIGIRVLTAATDSTGKPFAAASEIGLFKEQFDSVPFVEGNTGKEIKTSELTLKEVTVAEDTTKGGKEGNEGEKTGKLLTFAFEPIQWGSKGTAT
ncbi:MAG: hypothetical protein IKW28_07185, partial [Lachnospiraceae bacterium]|nr:hypothetical protein [Lachnospiraceae bacterium]